MTGFLIRFSKLMDNFGKFQNKSPYQQLYLILCQTNTTPCWAVPPVKTTYKVEKRKSKPSLVVVLLLVTNPFLDRRSPKRLKRRRSSGFSVAGDSWRRLTEQRVRWIWALRFCSIPYCLRFSTDPSRWSPNAVSGTMSRNNLCLYNLCCCW